MFRQFAILVAPLFCLLSSVQVSLLAQDEAGRPSQQPPATTSRQGLDDKLLDGLPAGPAGGKTQTPPAEVKRSDGASAPGQGAVLDPFAEGSDIGSSNPLLRIGRHMHQVRQRLIERDVSPQTQETQRQIVTELNELIASLAEQQQSAAQQRRSERPKDAQQGSQALKQAAREDNGKLAKDETQAAETAAMREATSEIWGHLPERFRTQMQNAGAIEFLPRYRKLIEDYYRRLAEDRGLGY